MCKFHQDAAAHVATDPSTGRRDPAREAIIRVALSRYWIERYIEGSEAITGYNPYAMASADQQKAFEKSGLKHPLDKVQADEIPLVDYLRDRLDRLARRQDISIKGLGLPMASARNAFLDWASADFYHGDPKGEFPLTGQPGDKKLVALHRAVAFFQDDPESEAVLERLIKGRIGRLYSEAPRKTRPLVNAALACVPAPVRDASAALARQGSNLALGGFSGVIGHGVHYASVLGAGLASGAASSANLTLSGAFLAASYAGWQSVFGGRYRAAREQVSSFAVQAGLTLAVAFGMQAALPRHHDHHIDYRKTEWLDSLDPVTRSAFLKPQREKYDSLPEALRVRLDIAAKQQNLTPEIFLMTCTGDDAVTREIDDYLLARQAKGQTNQSLHR